MAGSKAAPQTGGDDAAAKAAADAEATAAAEAADAEATEEVEETRYKVVGAAVVLRADDGSERYLYRGAPVDPAVWAEDSIEHATAVGLIAEA